MVSGSREFGRAAGFIVARRWLWPLLALLLVAASLGRIDRIVPLEADSRVLFSEDNPDRLALDEFESIFNRIDNLLIIVEAGNGDIFDPEVLRAIGAITEQGWLLPYARRVDSITNFQYTRAEGDDLIVRDLIEDPANVTPQQAEEAKAVALGRVELLDRFITASADVSMIQVQFARPRVDQTAEVQAVVAAGEELKDAFEAEFPGIDVRVFGSAVMANQFALSGSEDIRTLMGPMFLVILATIWLASGSLFGTLSVLAVIVCASLTGLGALGWMDVRLNAVTVVGPLYIMVLAVAAAVHVISAVRQNMPETADRTEWVGKALADHMRAIVITGVTTAIGFFSLNFSISPPLAQLGTMVGTGVLAATFLAVTLLPSLMLLFPLRRRAQSPAVEAVMCRLAEFVIAKRRLLLPLTAGLALVLAGGVTKLTFDDDVLRYFDERFEYRQDIDFIEDRLTGLSNLDFPLRSGEPQGINNPEFLTEVAEFTAWLRSQPEVVYVNSLTDTIARLNMNLHGEDPSRHRIPDTRQEVSELLFLYELNLGYGMDLNDRIDVDRELVRVTAFMARQSSAQMHELTLRAGAWFEQNAPLLQKNWSNRYPDVERVTPTGPTHVFNLISLRDSRAMLAGTLLALVLISGIIVIALRDVRIGLVSLLPNLIPAATAFGIWGYSVGTITLAVSVVVAATLGIVVDDTVHTLSKYSLARKAGMSAEDAVRYMFRSVGMAIMVSSIGLVAGFTILAQSGFDVNGDMAKLSAITIAMALLADLFLLPSLLIWWDSRKARPAGLAAAVGGAALGGLALLGTADADAQTAEERAMAIVLEADRRDSGFGSYQVDGEMILRDRSGRESRRRFSFMTLERAEAEVGDMSIIVFREPPDTRDIGLLTHANIEPVNDDQWLYLPAVKRVKRVSSSNRSGKFVASEFSYEDLGSQEVGDFDRVWIRDEPCPTEPELICFVLEDYPKNEKSGYSRRVTWIDQTEYRWHFVEFYNRRGELEKTMTVTGYEQFLERYWRAASMNMVNVQTGKSTELVWTNYRFRTGLTENDFSTQRLRSRAAIR